MSSSWSQKLQSRLDKLADTASAESVETLAKWIGFNRKHGSSMGEALKQALLSKDLSSTRKILYLKVIHQVMLLEYGESKWDKLADLRVVMGEQVLIPCLSSASESQVWVEELTPLIKEWDSKNVFGGPTLITRMRKLISDADAMKKEVKEQEDEHETKDKPNHAKAAEPEQEEPSEQKPAAMDEEPKVETEKRAPSQKEEPPKRRESIGGEVDFDFDAQGIPYAKVDSREFLEPCKAIATLQIARDLRSDVAVTLSSQLSAIPKEVGQACQQYSDGKEIPKELAEKLATLIPEDVLDADLTEALQTVETFLEIVLKQQEARKQLIQLLIQSRCQFGSEDAAEAFYKTEELVARLKERKGLLSDAMDLEGIDVAEEVGEDSNKKKDDKPLEPLTWYKPAGDDESKPDAKRAKVE